jgi:hypothetical protein
MKNELITQNESYIKNLIYTIRDKQVMLDSDLAELYNVSTSRLNEQVKRNIERFPDDFMFQLTENEFENLKSQNATSSLTSQNAILKDKRGKHRKYLPYVFTEQGVAGLSGVLKSATASKIHIDIIRTFVEMRKIINSNNSLIQRVSNIELKQFDNELKFNKIFNALENNELKQNNGVFFNGQIFDAYVFISDLIKSAKEEIILIDNFIDESVLVHLNKRNKNVAVKIYSNFDNKNSKLDIKKYSQQYKNIEFINFNKSHDRFLIIDNKELYHIGASLKDLGKKWFAFSKMDTLLNEVLIKLKELFHTPLQ